MTTRTLIGILTCAVIGTSGLRSAAAEEGLFNLHLSAGAGILANGEVATGIQKIGAAFSAKVDVPVHRWVAPQLGYGLIYLPGDGGAESGIHLVFAGARVRILNDEKGHLAQLWPRGPRGNAWGNLWVDLGLGYAHAPTAGGDAHWFALEVGVGYEFSLISPLQIGPYVSYRQVFIKENYPAVISIGLSISFGWPKKLPKQRVVKPQRPRPQPRPNIQGRRGDRDGDTVGDAIDKCPSTPPGKKVDENGCEYVRGRMVLPALNFKPHTAELAPGAIFEIRRMAEIVKANPNVQCEVGGHTDEPGSFEANLKFSLKRAQVVHAELLKLGVPARQLSVKGYGVSAPLTREITPEAKQRNIRIEFRFTVGQPKADTPAPEPRRPDAPRRP